MRNRRHLNHFLQQQKPEDCWTFTQLLSCAGRERGACRIGGSDVRSPFAFPSSMLGTEALHC